MSVNMPNHPFPSDSISHAAKPNEPLPPIHSNSTSTPDTVGAAPKLGKSIISESLAPKLEDPQISIVGAYKIYAAAMSNYRRYFSASDDANLEASHKFSILAVDQAHEFAQLIAQKEAALAKLQGEIRNKLNGLQKKIDEMKERFKTHQTAIDQINAGNGQEKKEYEELTRAYDDYVAKMKSMGAIDQGNGNFLIPEDSEKAKNIKDQYNQFTNDYQKAVTKFNTYWKGRADQINKYDAATVAYNQNVAEYNKAINEFITQNHLSDYLKEKGIVIPQLNNASRRDLSGYQDQMHFPPLIKSVPSTISAYPPPNYMHSIAQAGPPAMPKLNDYSSFDAQNLYSVLFQSEYENQIASFDQAILQYTSFWAFIMNRKVHELANKDLSSSETLLNSKILANKLIPPHLTSVSSSSAVSSLAMQALDMHIPHLQTILGKALIKEAIANSEIRAWEKLKDAEKEQKLNQLADQVLLLSIGLLGNLNIQALLPSLGMVAEHLPSLPKDSPTFAILFAVSLSNRILENIAQGTSTQALDSFLQTTPELASLSAEDKLKLSAAFQLGLLLTTGKLLENNLGLPGLFAQILSSLFPQLDLTKVIPEAQQENQQTNRELQAGIKEHFVAQGYPEDKAQFLAQAGVELTQSGLLAPNVTAHISAQTLNRPLLENSIKAELALGKYALTEADAIAHEAVDRTLIEGPYALTQQFRSALEGHLTDLRVKNSLEIVKSAIIIPPTIPFNQEATSKHSPREWNTILQERTLKLLTSHLGPQLAQQVHQEIAKTLFGTPYPTSNDVADIQSPYAWVKVVKDQVNQLVNIEQKNTVLETWEDRIRETFKESIKTLESFYSFSLKLMDPASSFIFASTIIHGDGRARKKGIDISI